MRSRWLPWRRAGRLLAREILDVALPPVCAACGVAGAVLCRGCAWHLVRRPAAGCRRCGEVLGPDGACHGDHRPLRHVRLLVAPYRYVGTGGALVRRLKLDGDAGAGALLRRAMAVAWRQTADRSWRRAVLVPVPLHWSRRRERGFDQALWLAQGLAPRLGLELAPRALRRRRATLPQGDPRVRSRAENLRDAMVLAAAAPVRGRDTVLVDDVFTSGATARVCAALLRAAGARRVAVLAACRS